jgi:septum formation protein
MDLFSGAISDAQVVTMIVLASASPRRKELLQQIGVPFVVLVADIDETPLQGETPSDYVARLAVAKARHVAQKTDLPVLAADTTVVLDGHILGKPESAEHWRQMLESMSGQQQEVMTAVALVTGDMVEFHVVTTRVSFRCLSAAMIDAYIATGEGLDKAGGYGIQGMGAVLVSAIEGSYSNVVGLPLSEVSQLLEHAGLPFWVRD